MKRIDIHTKIENVRLIAKVLKKVGISTEIPDTAKTAIVDTSKQIVQANNVNNQFVKTTIDTTVQNIQAFSNNINAFAELNKNIIQSWTTPFTLQN